MNTDTGGAHADAGRLAHIKALLGRYPNVSPAEVADLKTWFMREASALDVGTLASDDEIRSGYTQFRKDHIEPYGTREIVIVVITALVVVGAVALIGYLAG